jgi:hypothetical protein
MRAPEADFDVSRIYWVGPLTILSSVVAVFATHWAGMTFMPVDRFIAPLGPGPTVIDTVLFVGIAVFVFTTIAARGYPEPRRYYRRLAFICLLVSFVPDLLLPTTWPSKGLLMAEHVTAWLVTVEFLTRLV